MPSFYDDNFGFYNDMDDPDVQDFYRENQRKSVWKRCAGCGRKVKLLPQYDVCDSCATKREQGADF